MTRIIFILLLFVSTWPEITSAQTIPALSFEIKKPKKLENKKLGSERGADKKFTPPRRFVQNTFTRFNWYFNANEKLKEIIARAKSTHQDDFTELLSFYNYSTTATLRDSIELDSVIYKANAGILLHDLRNDWADNLYLLMGKAYFFRQTFDTAYLTFQYINYAFSPKEADGYDKPIGSNANEGGNAFSISTKESDNFVKKAFTRPPSRNESFLWLIRTYLAQDEYAEAAGMIETLKHDPLFPERLLPALHEVQALWFYQQNSFDSAAHYLEKALEQAENREEKARWEFLIGQLYERCGKHPEAQHFFEQAVKHSLDPVLEVYARLNIIRQNKGNDEKIIQQNIDALLKMARKDRYTNYRDILYYSVAQMELERNNRSAAIEYLLRSTRAAIPRSADPKQKSRSFLLLGDLAYADAAYIAAKQFYDSIQNPEVIPDLSRFNNRRDALGRIAAHAGVIERQDSLQRIAALPEAERELFVKKMLRKLRKARGLKEEETVQRPVPVNPNAPPPDLFDNTAKGDWYFYNADLKSRGYSEFKSKWGTRPNVDNWRRQAAVALATQKKSSDDAASGRAAPDDNSDELTYEALLKKLPLTEEGLKRSNDSLEQAQLELGRALLEGLEDYPAAIRELESFCDRFSYSQRRPEALGYLYYCYLKTGNAEKAAQVKAELQARYAGTEQEKRVSNPEAAGKPDPAKADMTHRYEKIYTLFIEGSFNAALAEKRIADSLYANNYWTPQLLYIESIYYIRERKDDSAKRVLQDIINLFPSTTMAEKARSIIDVLNRRKEIEAYLTQLEVTRPAEDSVVAGNTEPARVSPRAVTPPATTDRDTARIAPPDTDSAGQKKTVLPPTVIKPSKVEADSSPVVQKPVPVPGEYSFDRQQPHYVVILTDKVDGVFVSETRNAFNRYNQANFYNTPISISSEILTDSSRLVLMKNFSTADAALAYLEKVRKVAATEIVPWLPVAKYKFAIISEANLEILRTRKETQSFLNFLKTTLPEQFK